MTTREISTRASDPGSNSRAFPWPVLEAGNNSFPNGVYKVACHDKEAGKSFELRHELRGATLIEQWAEQGKLDFVCTVAAPRSMYRTIHKSDAPEQLIAWQQQDLGEYPMFTPMIVAKENIQHTTDAVSDGLSRIWNGRELLVPKGGRVVVGHTFKFKSGISGLLDFNLDKDLALGQFRVQPSNEDGFKFKVHLAENLYQHLRHHREEIVGRNIMVHVVSVALSILQRDYSTDDEDEGEGWQSHRNLIGLADQIEQKGFHHWSDEKFQASLVATGLYPHIIPSKGV